MAPLFMVLLRFAAQRDRAAALMDAHKAWIAAGFEDGVFLLTGSLAGGGGGVLAHNIARDALETRIAMDPFVAEGVVEAEIVEIAPGRVDDRLAFLAETP